MKIFIVLITMISLVGCSTREKINNSLVIEKPNIEGVKKKTEDLEGTYRTENGSIIKITHDGKYSLHKKYLGKPDDFSKGIIGYKYNKYTLSSYDSISSSLISHKIRKLHNSNYSLDSIYIEIISPFTYNINKNIFIKEDYPFCTDYPLIFIVSNLEGKQFLFRKSNFSISRHYKSSYVNSFFITIIPNLLCVPFVKESQLGIETITVFDSNINYVNIYLPDLTLNRFNYLKLKDIELKNVTNKSFDLLEEKFIKD